MDTIFYSWQSDLPSSTNRTFIERCLERAIRELRKEGSVAVDPSLDRDTAGIPGSPDIAETIFDKIKASSAFVADVSFINDCAHDNSHGLHADKCACTRLTPNPNVITELGYAAGTIGMDRIIGVLNEATGPIEKLPFDLPRRRIVTYRSFEDVDKEDAKAQLVSVLKARLKQILDLPRNEELKKQFLAQVGGRWRLEYGDLMSKVRGVDDVLEFTTDGKYFIQDPQSRQLIHAYDLANIEFDPKSRRASFDKVNARANSSPRHPKGLTHSREILEISADGSKMVGHVESDRSPLRYFRVK